jgi:DNA-binding MarR family transcriptional regulator
MPSLADCFVPDDILIFKLQDSELRLLMAELSSYLLQQNRPFNNTNLVDSMAAKLKVGKTAVTKALDTLESESLVQV